MIKILFQSTYYQLLISLRIKQAVFFSLAFPLLLFLVFGSIWGAQDARYTPFLLSGIIGMNTASEGLFAMGPVIRKYYTEGLIKYLRKLPFSILLHFSGLIISRIIVLLFTTLLLGLCARLVFGYTVSLDEGLRYGLGIAIGLFSFSFLGLSIAFSGIKKGVDTGIINLIYFIILFTSNAFYPVAAFNKTVGFIGNLLPLNPILAVLRGTGFHFMLLCWLILPMLSFYALFKKIKFDR